MTQKSKPRPARRLVLLAAALLLAAIVAIPASGVALAQSPPPDSDDITPVSSTGQALVNRDRQMVERKKEGEFVARPILSRKTDVLYYSIRHPDTGAWITNTYRVQGGEKQLSEGWEYTFEYPALDKQPESTPSGPSCWCWPCPAPAAATTTSSTPWFPSTSPRACGTGCWALSTPTAGPGPPPGG